MTDLKISQLTGATTPLAGTEVLPVVQSSSTKKVSVANLTAGRAVSVGSLASAGSVQIGTSGPYAVGTVYADANWGMLFTAATSAPANSDYGWLNYAGATLAKINSNNFVLESGNFVPNTAGKGINFTANTPAAGKTSQLLNWYEEGTFTPAIVGSNSAGSGTYTTQTARYTRIGNQVTVSINLVWSAHTGTGDMSVSGLPFTSGSAVSSPISVAAYNLSVSAGWYLTGRIQTNSTSIQLLQMPTGGGTWASVPMDTSVDALIITATYFV